MARKRLSDLLREEAKKPADAAVDVEVADADAADVSTADASAAPASSLASDTDPAPEADATASNRRDSATKDLEGAIAELQSTLETERQSAQHQQDSLRKEEAQLQSQLQAQMDLVQTLKAETQQIQQLKTDLAVAQAESQPIQQLKAELEEARKVILQLSEANQQLQAQLKAPTQPLAAAKTQSAAPQPLPLPSSPEPGLGKTQPKRQTAPSGIVPMPGRDLPKGREPLQHEVALRKILDHPTPRTALPDMPSERDSKLGEIDIGWMD